MRAHDRSRSPHNKQDAERISRIICTFGRYPEKRPQGLQVDGNGTFRLDNLMNVWGKGEGLRERDVLRAMRKHMFHESDEGVSSLRFGVDKDDQGYIVIRVLPRRPCSTGASTPAIATEQQARVEDTRGHARRMLGDPRMQGPLDRLVQLAAARAAGGVVAPTQIGAEGNTDLAAAAAVAAAVVPPANYSGRGCASAEGAGGAGGGAAACGVCGVPGPGAGPASHGGRAARVRHALEQMGLTPGSQHLRRGGTPAGPPCERHAGLGRHAFQDDHLDEGLGGDHSTGLRYGRMRHRQLFRRPMRSSVERIQRFIGWLLKRGYLEFGVPLCKGWALLDDVADVLEEEMGGLGDCDPELLGRFLMETDLDGRFEVSRGHVRHVPREERQRSSFHWSPLLRGGAVACGGSHSTATSALSTPRLGELQRPQAAVGRHQEPGSRASSVSSGRSPRRRAARISRTPSPDEDGTLAETCRRSLQLSADVPMQQATGGEQDEQVAPAVRATAVVQGAPTVSVGVHPAGFPVPTAPPAPVPEPVAEQRPATVPAAAATAATSVAGATAAPSGMAAPVQQRPFRAPPRERGSVRRAQARPPAVASEEVKNEIDICGP